MLLADNKIYRQFIRRNLILLICFYFQYNRCYFKFFSFIPQAEIFLKCEWLKGNCRNQNSRASGHRTKISRALETDQSHQASLCFFPLIQKKILELRKYTNFYFLNAYFITFSPYHSCFTVIDCNLSIMINGCV